MSTASGSSDGATSSIGDSPGKPKKARSVTKSKGIEDDNDYTELMTAMAEKMRTADEFRSPEDVKSDLVSERSAAKDVVK